MRRVVLSAVLSAALTVALPAFADDAGAPAAAAPATAAKPAKPDKDDPNRIICRREHVVGTNRPQKVCLTAAQRGMAKDAADASLDDRRLPEPPAPGSSGS